MPIARDTLSTDEIAALRRTVEGHPTLPLAARAIGLSAPTLTRVLATLPVSKLTAEYVRHYVSESRNER